MDYRYGWIQLIFAEIENWKHGNKIIFKYVNNTMRPVFNIFLKIKWMWIPW